MTSSSKVWEAIWTEAPETGDTVFDKIIRKEIGAEIIFEDRDVLAFHDVIPQTPVHLVVIPKKLVFLSECESGAGAEDAGLLLKLLTTVYNCAAKEGLADESYSVVINNGKTETPAWLAGELKYYLHIHVLGYK